MNKIVLYSFLSLFFLQALYGKEESKRNRLHSTLMNVNCKRNDTCYCSPEYQSSHTNPYVASSVRIPKKYRPRCLDCGGHKQRKRMTLEEIEDAQRAIDTDNLERSQKENNDMESKFENDINQQEEFLI